MGLNLSLSKQEKRAFKIQPSWLSCISSNLWLIAGHLQAVFSYFCISLYFAGKIPTSRVLCMFLLVGLAFILPVCSCMKYKEKSQGSLGFTVFKGEKKKKFFVRNVLVKKNIWDEGRKGHARSSSPAPRGAEASSLYNPAHKLINCFNSTFFTLKDIKLFFFLMSVTAAGGRLL